MPLNINKLNMNLIDRIKHSEGFRSTVYRCTRNFDTIGYGFAIKDLVLDEDIADEILVRKLNDLMRAINKKFNWVEGLPKEAQDVVIEMCYQLGVSGFSKFKKSINYLKNHDFKNASSEILRSVWAEQTPNRAKELSNILSKL